MFAWIFRRIFAPFGGSSVAAAPNVLSLVYAEYPTRATAPCRYATRETVPCAYTRETVLCDPE